MRSLPDGPAHSEFRGYERRLQDNMPPL